MSCAAFAAVVLLASLRASADEEPDPRDDPRTLDAEIWTAVGSTSVMRLEGDDNTEIMFMTGVLGVARFAPFEVGVSLDVGGQDEDLHVLVGPVLGLGIDIMTGVRAEGLVEIGGHFVDGIGYKWAFTEEGATGNESVWLFQGGLRLGLSARIGRDTPRIVAGGWVAVFRDLTTSNETITYPGGVDTEYWEVGGSTGLVAVRFGFEW